MYMLVAFLALLAFLGGFGGKSAKNVECAKEIIIYQKHTYCNCNFSCFYENYVYFCTKLTKQG